MRLLQVSFLLTVLLLTNFSLGAEETVLDQEQEQEVSKKDLDKTWGIMPIPMIAYMPETSLLASVILSVYNNPNPDNPDQKVDNALIATYYTLKNQTGISFSGEKYFGGNSYKLSLLLNGSKFPTNFYGIGNDVNDYDIEKYENRSFDIKSSFMFEVKRNIYLGPIVNFYTDTLEDIEEGKLLASGLIDGSNGITQIGTGIALTIDTRDSYSFPHKGILCEIKWKMFNNNIWSDYSYNHLTINFRHFFQIKVDHIIGINALYDMTTGDVPFQRLPALGGNSIMRGFVQDKYRDKLYAAFQTEYRFPVMGRIGGSVFASAGNVVSNIEDFANMDIKTAAGLGLRINLDKKQHINIRIDLAYNNDGETNFYLSLLEAF